MFDNQFLSMSTFNFINSTSLHFELLQKLKHLYKMIYGLCLNITSFFPKYFLQILQVSFSMGQNHSKNEWLEYSSKDFFQQQIDFYKWRSNPQINTHICRVKFQLQQSIQDRQKLKLLLETKFQTGQYVSLNEILKLAQNKTTKEELMNFQKYVCTLHDFQERLTLPQALHCLQILFSGYELLYAKKGKLKVKLIYIFVTRQGQLRCWFNKDYKSNDIFQDQNEIDRNSPFLTSQLAIIKKIVELGQKLATNHTQYLHFSRQFRSYMDRDILHNWNFSNARKLINSYAYTYKLHLPNNLKQTLKSMLQSSSLTTISVHSFSQIQSSHTSLKQSKNAFVSTGDMVTCKQQAASNPGSSRKQNQQRPISLSDYSNKKSEQNLQTLYKMHSKKFSSIDLKNVNDRSSKYYQTPKLSRSELVSNHSQSQYRIKRKESTFRQTPTNQTGNKMRRQRQFAFVGQSPEAKLNSTQFTPYSHSYSITQYENGEGSNQRLQDSKIKNKQNMNQSILKPNQITRQKKKLQKKAAVISKYISFYKQQKLLSKDQISKSSSFFQNYPQQKFSDEKINISPPPPYENLSKKPQIHKEQQFIKQQLSQPKLDLPKKPSSNLLPVGNKLTFQDFQSNTSWIMPFKGKTQNMKESKNNQSNLVSQNSSVHQMCHTIKTFNKLVNNSQVSLHQSNGSFSSINQSESSQYKGMLAKMGRSVNVINVPSNKNINTMIKKPSTNSHLNKSIYN